MDTSAQPPAADTIGYLHSVETGAAVDGPGVRFVYFVSGCQFRCLYCHNPDTWKLHHGRKVSVSEALSELKPYAGFLRFAGGVTVSGGEPLMQPDFVHGLLSGAKAMGLNTALDTQGFLHENVDDVWFDVVDLVLLDIKHSDPAQYQALTAQPLQPTLDFARRLAQLGKKMWIRYVLVPGLTDGFDDVERLAGFAASLGDAVERVEVLPFHKLGEAKWAELGMPYTLADTPAPPPELTERVRGQFRSRGLNVH
ncbi:pyruvate formate-lyase-activating protein [Crenobacter caeni]|uniref:Pyruvate formate-lyase-activating enzyme n=1 Tax=Crenobacter caeni TaxID=2705474 RepID=A0A6B2KU33_9NEIS|nr:pyruvate formate-lyase-activating protein [Crenobacter caeni]NDV13509.1 pyruvate formate lyase-activating protein [Crenobacter caeni]